MNSALSEIKITKSCQRKLVRWALCTKKEINYVCAGSEGNRITYVVRLRNAANITRHFFIRNERQYKYELEKIQRLKLKVICCGHSHPSGPSHPSYYDCLWLRGKTELIVVIKDGDAKLTAWKIHKTARKTKMFGKISIKVN